MFMKRLGFIYNHLEEIILVTIFAVMVSVIFLQVVMRRVFNNSLSWSEELGRFTFEWLTWIGISLGARLGQHIKITLLTDRLPHRLAQMMNILSELIVISICLLTMNYGIELCKIFHGSHYAMLRISLAWGYASVVVGFGLMTIRSLVSIKNSIVCLVTGNPLVSQDEGGAM